MFGNNYNMAFLSKTDSEKRPVSKRSKKRFYWSSKCMLRKIDIPYMACDHIGSLSEERLKVNILIMSFIELMFSLSNI